MTINFEYLTDLSSRLDKFAHYIIKHHDGMPDHACAQCVPEGELVKEGFRCAYHDALELFRELGLDLPRREEDLPAQEPPKTKKL